MRLNGDGITSPSSRNDIHIRVLENFHWISSSSLKNSCKMLLRGLWKVISENAVENYHILWEAHQSAASLGLIAAINRDILIQNFWSYTFSTTKIILLLVYLTTTLWNEFDIMAISMFRATKMEMIVYNPRSTSPVYWLIMNLLSVLRSERLDFPNKSQNRNLKLPPNL